MIVVIPAYQPDDRLVDLVNELREKTAYPILVVDDGSSSDRAPVFEAVGRICTVLRHPLHMGRGRAVKTALSYAVSAYPQEPGVVVADAGGSFNVSHILEVSDTLRVHPDSLVIGARRYRDKGPLRGRLNDTLFRYVFAFASGAKLRDPRSGLRAFSLRRIPELLDCPGEGAEYDVSVLLGCLQNHVPVLEVPVETARPDRQTDGRSLRQFIRVYSALFQYTGVAVLSFLVDYFLFRLFYRVLSGVDFSALVGISAVRICNVIARMLSSTLNFTLNRQLVFKDKGNLLASALKYYAVVVLILLVNTCLLMFLNEFCGIPAQIAKLITEAVLFTARLLLQRIFVFRGRSR